MSRVIGLDQSYTGFGYCFEGKAIKRAFPGGKYRGPGERLLGIEAWLEDSLLRDGPTDLVVREGYANAAKFGREIAGELGWAVDRTVYNVTGHWPLIVPPPSLKKFVTGKGNAKKNEMLLGVYKKWGVGFSDDNQADAFALEKFGRAYLAVQTGSYPAGNYLKYEIEAIEAVRKAK